MALAFRAFATNATFTGSAQTSMPTQGFNVQAGDIVVIGVGASNTSMTFGAVTDTIGNTYVLIGSVLTGSSWRYRFFMCAASIGANASNVVTSNFSSSTFVVVNAWSFASANSSIAFDVTALGNTSASSNITTGSFNTKFSDEVVCVAFLSNTTLTQANITPGSGYTKNTVTGIPIGTMMEYRILSAPQTGLVGNFTYTANVSGSVFAVAIGQSAGVPGSLMMLGCGT